jgi:hypothetical protein
MFKKKLIEFYCDDENVVKYFPPVAARTMLPEWYKALPLYVNNKKLDAKEMVAGNFRNIPQTIKACIPVLDYMTTGYIIRYPADILVTPETTADNLETWWWASEYVSCASHPHEQCPVKIEGREHQYFKVEHSWHIKTPPGYSCLFYQPEYFFDKRMQYLPAVVDTDDYHAPVLFTGIVKSKETFMLKAGDPMMAVFPFRRDAWDSEVTVKPRDQRLSVRMFLTKGYKKLMHKKKEFF